jgi:hypothetical protein
MINVCNQCGQYRADKIIDPGGPFAICPECGWKHPFKMLPLFIVSGASGTGKSSVCQALIGKIEAVVLDSDILWMPVFDTPETNYRNYFNIWLRQCKNIQQSGRPVVLFGGGMGVPANLEPCVERRYFSAIHILALTCRDEILVERLRARPAWRKSGDPQFIEDHLRFNHWFIETGSRMEPKIDLRDTSIATLDETVEQVKRWVEGLW